jgi:hypothetical protein
MEEQSNSGDGSCDDPLKESCSTLLVGSCKHCMSYHQLGLPEA